MGALEWPAVGSSVFSSPLVEFSALKGSGYQASTSSSATNITGASIPSRIGPHAWPTLTWFLVWS